MSTWTLTYGTTTQSLEAWGLRAQSMQLTRLNQGVDTVTVEAAADFDGSLTFAYGQGVSIAKDGVTWFAGKVRRHARMGAGREVIRYEFANAWWDLERTVMQTQWKSYNAADPSTPLTKNVSELMLGYTLAGARQTNGEAVAEILAWAITCGVSLQVGTIDAAASIPAINIRDVSCAEAIISMLRWTADVAWFDYSTNPPTFHARSAANLSTVSIAVNDAKIRELQLGARNDLVLPAVILRFKSFNDVDGFSYITHTTQKYPVDASETQIGAAVHTIDLVGMRIARAAATLETATIATGSLDWWKDKIPWLKNPLIASGSLSISDVTVKDRDNNTVSLAGYGNELIEGQIPPWLSADSMEVVIGAKATYTKLLAAGSTVKTNKAISAPISVRLVATNAANGTYYNTETAEAGEEIPAGLAQAIYTARQTLQYSGQVELVGDEAESTVHPGVKLTVTGTALTLSGLVVQQSVEEPHYGRVSVTVGPCTELGVDDLIELLRVSRNRMVMTSFSTRSSSISGNTGTLELGRKTPKENSNADASLEEYKAVVYDAGSGQTVMVESDAALGQWALKQVDSSGTKVAGIGSVLMSLTDAAGKEIKFREQPICIDGVQKYILVLCSEPYTK